MTSLRATLHTAFEPGHSLASGVLIGAIVLSIAGAVIGTAPAGATSGIPLAIETLCSLIFAAEYLARLWTAPPTLRLRGAASPLLVLDLIGLLPVVMIWLTPEMPDMILMLQMLRFLRLSRFSRGLQAMGTVFVAERGPLFASLVAGGGMLLTAATGMYLLEGHVQPDKLGSIPLAMYWAIITLATVGYGDIYPVTSAGKIFAGICAVSGIVFFALPVAIFASNRSGAAISS